MKTIGMLTISAICALGTVGCAYERDDRHAERWHHDHGYREYRERDREYGQAYFGPDMTPAADRDANMAAAVMADERDHDIGS
jgi:hypothetical protein